MLFVDLGALVPLWQEKTCGSELIFNSHNS